MSSRRVPGSERAATISLNYAERGNSNFPIVGNLVLGSGSELHDGPTSTQIVGQFIYFDQTSVTTLNLSAVDLGMDGCEYHGTAEETLRT